MEEEDPDEDDPIGLTASNAGVVKSRQRKSNGLIGGKMPKSKEMIDSDADDDGDEPSVLSGGPSFNPAYDQHYSSPYLPHSNVGTYCPRAE